jgi:hypothetical protein
MKRSNSKKDVEKAVENLGSYAQELKKQNKDFAELMDTIGIKEIPIKYDKPLHRGKKYVFSLKEILDIFRDQHSKEENVQFEKFMGHPLFMHIISIEQNFTTSPRETFTAHDDAVEGHLPMESGNYSLLVGVEHESFEGKSAPIKFKIEFEMKE